MRPQKQHGDCTPSPGTRWNNVGVVCPCMHAKAAWEFEVMWRLCGFCHEARSAAHKPCIVGLRYRSALGGLEGKRRALGTARW